MKILSLSVIAGWFLLGSTAFADPPNRTAELTQFYSDPTQVDLENEQDDLGPLTSARVKVYRHKVVLELETEEDILSIGFSDNRIELPVRDTDLAEGEITARRDTGGSGYEEIVLMDQSLIDWFTDLPRNPTTVRYRRFDQTGKLVTDLALGGKMLQRVLVCMLPESSNPLDIERQLLVARVDGEVLNAQRLGLWGLDPDQAPRAVTFSGRANSWVSLWYVSPRFNRFPNDLVSLADDVIMAELDSYYRGTESNWRYYVSEATHWEAPILISGTTDYIIDQFGEEELRYSFGSVDEGALMIVDTSDFETGVGFYFTTDLSGGIPFGHSSYSDLDCVIR